MKIRAGHITVLSAIFISGAHVGMLPYIFFFIDRVQANDKIDIAFLLGPMTAAYFLTIVRFALDNRYQRLIEDSREVNSLYVFISGFVPFLLLFLCMY